MTEISSHNDSMARELLGMLEFNQRNKFWRKFLTASVINWVMMTHKSSHDDSNDWWLRRMTELMQRMTQTNFGVILTLFAKVIDHLRQSTKEKQQQQQQQQKQQQQQNSPLLLGRRRSFGSRASKKLVWKWTIQKLKIFSKNWLLNYILENNFC